ncbi:MAG: transglycosylase SLT domain-containing protein [Bryobacterales bacterium]|nr:transglycosylase SLT domain-containing protein [Bryobacterales bacterium]
MNTAPVRFHEASEAPLVMSAAPPKEAPNFLKFEPRLPARERPDSRMRRAEQAFEKGKRAYLEGDFLTARTEFDSAIDILLSASENNPNRAELVRRLEELIDRIHRYDIEGLGAGDDPDVAGYEKSPLQEILEMTFPVDPTLKSKVHDQLRATSSELPLEENDEVLRYINFFSSDKGRRTLLAGLRRAGRYKSMISSILAEEGVPQELIYLAQAESGFMPRAISHKAAAGMWQFVQWRGREYGLNQTTHSDDRLDPEKATRAGAKHLKDLYNQFGDWYLAMAAYNCGPGCVQNAVRRTGYADFWTLRRIGVLPRETTNYVPLIVAMTIMVKNAKDYGIDLENLDPDPALVYDTVKVASPTSLSLMADVLDVPASQLRDLNPAILGNVAPAGYEVHIPKGAMEPLEAGLAAIPAEKRASWRSHRLADGETLASVAARFRVTPSRIVAVGRESGAELQAGDLLIIPAEYVAPAKRTVAKRWTAKRGAAGRSTVASKAVASKSVASKSASSKAVASRTTASKAPSRKPAGATASRYPRGARVASR